MFDMPLFLWALYATGIIQIIATPVLGLTGIFLGLLATDITLHDTCFVTILGAAVAFAVFFAAFVSFDSGQYQPDVQAKEAAQKYRRADAGLALQRDQPGGARRFSHRRGAAWPKMPR